VARRDRGNLDGGDFAIRDVHQARAARHRPALDLDRASTARPCLILGLPVSAHKTIDEGGFVEGEEIEIAAAIAVHPE
jgi:hypothetical protein